MDMERLNSISALGSLESFRVESWSAWIWKGIWIWKEEIAFEHQDHCKALGLKVWIWNIALEC